MNIFWRSTRSLTVLILAFLVFWAGQAKANFDGASYFPNLPVLDQDGRKLAFYDDVIKGKIVVVSFIYTSCPDICPLTTARMAQLEERLAPLVGKDIFFVSISVDPANDTPEKLKSFSKAFGAGPGWSFLTGQPDELRTIARSLGDRSTALYEHRNEVVIGNDATGEWSRNSLFGDLDRIETDVRSMDPVWRSQERIVPHNPASNNGHQLSPRPGEALYRRMCAPCHTIGVGDRVGPDLLGVTERRRHGWLINFIMRPDLMRAKKDPVAVNLMKSFEGVRMPRLGIADSDAADLVTYLKLQTNIILEARKTPGGGSGQAAGAHHHHHHKH